MVDPIRDLAGALKLCLALPMLLCPMLLGAEVQPEVLFVIGESEYETSVTLPRFAERELAPAGFRATFVHASEVDPHEFPGLEAALQTADLLFLSVRRRTLRDEQLAAIRQFLDDGKPLVAIRTSSHAFSMRDGNPAPGHAEWLGFDREVLGARYDNHLRNEKGTLVSTYSLADPHPILRGIGDAPFHSGGTLYKSLDLKRGTKVLLKGTTIGDGQPVEMPVAWVNQYGRARVFYTSLGHRDEFSKPVFNRLLANAVHWCLEIPVR